jgi:NAD(P)-dependent dehydrogenase (short-subunit alcohol dehydrogenase family)
MNGRLAGKVAFVTGIARGQGRCRMPMGLPWIEPDQISEAVVFLSSDSARYITGTVLPVDQGSTNKPG